MARAGVEGLGTASEVVKSPMNGGLRSFEKFCEGLRVDGEPFVLYPEARLMVEDYFAGVRETVILVPKKNGKTSLLAAVALHHLLVTENADCVVGASSKEQARILYQQAVKMIRSSGLEGAGPGLFKPQKGYLRVDSTWDAGFIRVMAADENTADGVIPTLALVDELHRHKSGGLYGVFRDGLGPRHGRMITISTAGDDETSPLGLLRSKAYSLPGAKQDGAYRRVRNPDFAMHEWALDETEDRDDLAVVKLANPAPWQTEEELRIRRDSPSMTPWQWARFACGVWMFGEQGAFSEKEWRACEDPDAVIPDGATGVFVGIDLGWKWDTTAIVPVWRRDDTLTVGDVTIIVPPRDGSRTRYTSVWDAVEALAERFAHPTFVIDPEADGEQLAQQMEAEFDAELVLHSQKSVPMALAAQRLSEAISAGRIKHPGIVGLTRHVLAAAPKPVGETWKLGKPHRSGAKIDAAVALAMAVSVAVGNPSSVYKDRGLLVV